MYNKKITFLTTPKPVKMIREVLFFSIIIRDLTSMDLKNPELNWF